MTVMSSGASVGFEGATESRPKVGCDLINAAKYAGRKFSCTENLVNIVVTLIFYFCYFKEPCSLSSVFDETAFAAQNLWN